MPSDDVTLSQLKRLFETMSEGVVLIDMEGKIIQANPAAERILGLKRSEIEGRHYTAPEWEILRPDGTYMKPEEMAGYRALTEKREIKNEIMGIKRTNGSIAWISVSAAPVINASGKQEGVVGTFDDVTKRKQMEEALRESEAKFKGISESTIDAVIMMGPEGNISYWNKSAEKLFGYASKEILGKSLHFLLAPKRYHNDFKKGFLNFKEDGKGKVINKIMELEAIKKDGSEFPIELSVSSIFILKNWHAVGIVRNISNRKQDEEALKESEEKYRQIFENFQDLYYRTDLNGILQALSPSVKPLAGYDPDELIGHPVTKVYHNPKERETFIKELTKYGRVTNYEIKLITKDKKIRDTSVSAHIVFDKEKKPVSIEGIIRDITEQKQAEEALDVEKSYMDQLFTNSLEAIAMGDRNHLVMRVNDEFTRIFGYTNEEAKGKFVDDLIVPEDQLREAVKVTKRVARGDCVATEAIRKRKDGSIVEVSFIASPIIIEKKRVGVYGIYRDISHRKKAERGLQESEERLRSTFSSMDDLVFVLDKDGIFLDFYQPPGKSDLFKPVEEFIGKSYKKVMPAAVVEPAQKSIKAVKANDTVEQFDYPIQIGSQELWFNAKVSMRKDDRGEFDGVVIVSRDITERRNMEEDLKMAKEAAETANRTKSEFLANLSHEIRTPINAVMGFTELLFSLISEKNQRNYLESIKTAGRSLLSLINDILDLSKIEADAIELHNNSVNPYMIFKEISQIFEMRLSSKKVKFIVDIERDLPPTIMIDEARLRQVLFNIIGNALKFTHTGHIKLSVKKRQKPRDYNKINLIISVEDTGIGIPKDHLETIFESFKQVNGKSSRKYGGTGLGLTISKRLIEMMGGKITVQSTLGAGSVFTIVLRDVDVSYSKATYIVKDKIFDIKKLTFEKALILVVDNNESDRNLIKEWLVQVGLDIIDADDGKKALRLVKEFSPDIIITDIKMPVMDGYELVKRLKDDPQTREMPIIAVTALINTDDKSQIIKFGFDGYLSKPLNMYGLFTELSRYLTHVEKEEPDKEKVRTEKLLMNLHPENMRRFREFYSVLAKQIVPKWKELKRIKGLMEMEDIEDFSKKLFRMAKEYRVKGLIDYSKQLYDSVQSYELYEIEESLAQFKEIMKEIANMWSKQNGKR